MANTEILKPLVYNIDGVEYTLEFNRNAARSAERMGLTMKDVLEMSTPMTTLPLLFFAAFKMHHPDMTRDKADKIYFDVLHGLEQPEMERLVMLFTETYSTLMRDEGAAERKNVTVSL